jgi:hypothetical protein
MDEDYIRRLLMGEMRRHGLSPQEAARDLARGLGLDPRSLDPILLRLHEEARRNRILDTPPGVYDTEDEVRGLDWYHGPQAGDVFWPRLRLRLEAGTMRSVVGEIDRASTKVVAHLAAPYIHNLKKRGLVVGYVQSGKTANYTSVMAKAADASYKFFIVLSGLHNNLRHQTQVRVSTDLGADAWHNWTTPDADFGGATGGAAILTGDVPSLAVVKKNQKRLESLRDWLRAIPAVVRERTPILLLDDEADQATPSTARQQAEKRGINKLVREIWDEIKSGTYVGYTATPFANVFMDPTDDGELYPADFIIDLPRPVAYYGAERVFGREPLDDADEPDPGLDMVRLVGDADGLRPPSKRADREDFDPNLPESLEAAITWFIVATSIRRAREGTDEHSSMLVHTTHYVRPHFAMKGRIDHLLNKMRVDVQTGNSARFAASYADEAHRAEGEASLPLPGWAEVEPHLSQVLDCVRVVVDNGYSSDRLDYGREDTSGPVIETVIAVGGGTLSRGLTLEGLVVSYFTRTSNTYDTLLQMGRWFGYRPGYEDLPRIWMQDGLSDDYRFLALIEEEIRQDMRHLERMKVTPRQFGVRVRAHPGRLAIVARNKMGAANRVRVTYSGQRLQTFIFDEANTPPAIGGVGTLDHNLSIAREFIAACTRHREFEQVDNKSRWVVRDVPAAQIVSLIRGYRFHPDQTTVRRDDMAGWVEQSASDRLWNVVVMGSKKEHKARDGSAIALVPVDLGLQRTVPSVNRAPLSDPSAATGNANIKALMSHNDWFVDLDPLALAALDESVRADPREVRRRLADGHGMVVVYPVSRASVPMGVAEGMGTRRPMEASQDLIGLGIIFPDIDREGFATEGEYYSVHPDWEVSMSEEDEDEIPIDLEGSAGAPDGGAGSSDE